MDATVYGAFISVAGDPQNDLRLLAAMPSWTIPQIVGSVLLPTGDGLTPGGTAVAQRSVGCLLNGGRRPKQFRGQGPLDTRPFS